MSFLLLGIEAVFNLLLFNLCMAGYVPRARNKNDGLFVFFFCFSFLLLLIKLHLAGV